MGARLNRLNARARRNPVVALILASALMAGLFAYIGGASDGNFVPDAIEDTLVDEAFAGTSYRMRCTIPSDIASGLGGRSATGTSSKLSNAIAIAFNKAVQNKKGKNWRAFYDSWDGEVTIKSRKNSKKPWQEQYAFDGPSHCVTLNSP